MFKPQFLHHLGCPNMTFGAIGSDPELNGHVQTDTGVFYESLVFFNMWTYIYRGQCSMARPVKEEKTLRIAEEQVFCEAVLLNNPLALYMLPV